MTSLEQLIKKAEDFRYNTNDLGGHSNYMNLLFQIMEIDMNAGVPLWKDVIINYRFENRSQDFTYIALDNYLNKFGFENTLDLFKKDPELEKLLFCESREISEKFLKLLIDFSTPKILNHYLSLIEKNTTDKMLRISQKRKECLANQYSRLRASSYGFRLDFFIEHFSPTIDFILKYYPDRASDERIVAYQTWAMEACDNWRKYNESFNVDYYTPNIYMPKYVDISIDWSKLQPSTQNTLSAVPEVSEKITDIISPIKNVNDGIHNISVIKDIFSLCLKKYEIFSIAPDVGGKKSAIMQFIAQNCSAWFRFNSFFPFDDSSFTLCCFSKSKWDTALFEIQQQCIYTTKDDTSSNEIVLGGVGLSHYFRYLKWDMVSEKYSPIAGMYPLFYESGADKKRIEKIQYWADSMGEESFGRILKAIVDDLLPLLNGIYDTQRNHVAKYSRDQLRNGRESLTKAMIDSGFFKTRWINEQKLYNFIQSFYPDSIYQFHPVWLGQQSLDIYIPSIKTAIEYQGRQHYEAVDFFGGEDGLKKRQELDQRKRKICVENQVRLLEWPYTIPVDKAHVMKFIKSNLYLT